MSSVTAPPERWQALGALLPARRVQIDPQYSSRSAFARATGLNDRLVADLERARRNTYRDTTLAAAEQAYRIRPGDLERFLAGEVDSLTPGNEAAPDYPDYDVGGDDSVEGRLDREDPLGQDERLEWGPPTPDGWRYYTLCRIEDGRPVANVGLELPDEPTPEVIESEVLPKIRPLLQVVVMTGSGHAAPHSKQ